MAGTLHQQSLVSPRPWTNKSGIWYDANGEIIADILEGWLSNYDAAYATGYNEALEAVKGDDNGKKS